MLTMKKAILVAGCLLTVSTVSYAGSDWLKGAPDQEIKTLAAVQPGLGTIMIEYSHRFAAMYYAAKGGNWGMAGYQLQEMREAQEVGENTRPQFAPGLKAFESETLEKLNAAINAKNWKKFNGEFKQAVVACNVCHAANDHPFIKYQLPKSSPSPTSNKP